MREAWILGDRSARLQTDLLRGMLDLARPECGLTTLTFGARALAASIQLLAVELPGSSDGPPKLVEAYVRGGDLVASYASTERHPIAVQVYWRSHSDAAARSAAIDLEISVQTPLLDSDPTLTTHSRLPPGDVVAIGAGGTSTCWLLRPANAEWSYVEMVDAATACASDVAADASESALRHRLFADRLEKGVILRARVRGVFLDRKDDVERAETAYRAYLDSPPPLTT